MVYVHGGMYATNGGNDRQVPPEYMMDQDVIVVSIQYRLNILGNKKFENSRFIERNLEKCKIGEHGINRDAWKERKFPDNPIC